MRLVGPDYPRRGDPCSYLAPMLKAISSVARACAFVVSNEGGDCFACRVKMTAWEKLKGVRLQGVSDSVPLARHHISAQAELLAAFEHPKGVLRCPGLVSAESGEAPMGELWFQPQDKPAQAQLNEVAEAFRVRVNVTDDASLQRAVCWLRKAHLVTREVRQSPAHQAVYLTLEREERALSHWEKRFGLYDVARTGFVPCRVAFRQVKQAAIDMSVASQHLLTDIECVRSGTDLQIRLLTTPPLDLVLTVSELDASLHDAGLIHIAEKP